MEEGDAAEPVSPATESMAEGHEEFYDLNYVTDKAESSTSTEVSLSLNTHALSILEMCHDISVVFFEVACKHHGI